MSKPQGRPRLLSPEQVSEIRFEYTHPEGKRPTMKELGNRYNVHHMTIFNALHGRGPYGPPVKLVEEKPEEIPIFERKGEHVVFHKYSDLGMPQVGPGIDD